MSSLRGRIARLEAQHGGCPGCAQRPPLVGYETPSGRTIPCNDTDLGPCPDCGQPRELVIIRFAFDWHFDESEDPPAGSLRWERQHRLNPDPRDGQPSE